MADDKRPLDLALDVLVYVPVGLAVSARELLPKLAERGRERITGQVTTARIIGKFAVDQGQQQAGKAFTRAREQALGRIDQATAPAEAPAPRPPAARPAPRATSSPAGEELAIPGYDSLSASQVLPRLDGLAAVELEAVRSYEAAHRGRKTILGRIDQLQSAS